MKRLLLTCTDLMAIQFMVPHMRYLSENGFEVELACSVVGNRLEDLQKAVGDIVKIHTVRLVRSPYSPKNLSGYSDLKKLLEENRYDVIWTNEPVMGVMTRLAARKARKNGTKVVYMAHGFHFYKGAPLPNWLLYCPIEMIMSKFMDVLVTINWEDYHWAQKWLQIPHLVHIDGIGVDFSRLSGPDCRESTRKSLGISASQSMILSVGELQTRKNHEVIIRAIAKLNDPSIQYVICGRGKLLDKLTKLAESLGIQKQVSFLGYRNDVPEIMRAADIYAHPSKREGLGLASLEAMACGLPLVTSNVQGIPDYVVNGVTGFMCAPTDVDSFVKHIHILISKPDLLKNISNTNVIQAEKYAIAKIQETVLELITSAIID